MFKLRVKRTAPQGLLLTSSILMLSVLAFNILIYCVSPQYATYGSQHFVNTTISNQKISQPCPDVENPGIFYIYQNCLSI